MKNMKTGNDIYTIIKNRQLNRHETVVAESIEAFFHDVIPMLGRLSYLEKDGQILVPHTPQFVAYVYQKEERYRPMFDIKIIQEETFVDDGHKKWLDCMDGLTQEQKQKVVHDKEIFEFLDHVLAKKTSKTCSDSGCQA